MKNKLNIKPTFQLAGASIGMGMMGEALGNEGLKQAGTSTSKFVPIAANISAGSFVIKQLKGLKK